VAGEIPRNTNQPTRKMVSEFIVDLFKT